MVVCMCLSRVTLVGFLLISFSTKFISIASRLPSTILYKYLYTHRIYCLLSLKNLFSSVHSLGFFVSYNVLVIWQWMACHRYFWILFFVSLYPTRFIHSAHFIVDPHTSGVNVFTVFRCSPFSPKFHLRLFHHLYDQNGFFCAPIQSICRCWIVFIYFLIFLIVFVFVSTAFNGK